jgi:TfoX/Sxy family transcriptional regulator of competence genes
LTPSQRFAAVVEEFRGKAGVTVPSGEPGRRREFGSSGLKIKGKVFAMVSSNGDFVVRLPRERVDKLVASGEATRFDPRRNGRLMRGWAVMAPTSKTDWSQLAREAKIFVELE